MPVTETATSAPSRSRTPAAMAAAVSAETAPYRSSDLLRHAELAGLHLVRVGDDRSEEHVARARDRRQPLRPPARRCTTRPWRASARAPGTRPAPAPRRAAPSRLNRYRSIGAASRATARPPAASAPGVDDEVDVDLEVARADRRLDAVAVASSVRERLRHRRLARAEEAQQPPLRRPRPRAARAARAPPRARLAHRAAAAPAGGPGSTTTTASPLLEHEPRRRPGEPERVRALRNRRLLADARSRSRRTAGPSRSREPARDLADLRVQSVVEPKPHSRRARDELDGAVVVRRAEPTRDDAEVASLSPSVSASASSSSRSPTITIRAGLDPEPKQLPCEERPVQVAAVAADKLAAGDDDERAGSRVCHTPGRMPLRRDDQGLRPADRQTTRATVQHHRVRFSGRSSVIQSRLPVKSLPLPVLQRSLIEDRTRRGVRVDLQPAVAARRRHARGEPCFADTAGVFGVVAACLRLVAETDGRLLLRLAARPRDDHERRDGHDPEQRQQAPRGTAPGRRATAAAERLGREGLVLLPHDEAGVVLVDVELPVQARGTPRTSGGSP